MAKTKDHGPQIKDDERYLRQLCEEGLVWRYGTTEVSKEVRDRLEHELKIIAMKNFCSYFLIVWDFCNYAMENGIPVGARGSGVGTMVGYLLGLCNVDPVRYGRASAMLVDAPSSRRLPNRRWVTPASRTVESPLVPSARVSAKWAMATRA